MELLEKLGIDWRLLIAQIINFLILLFILYKFLYKPVLNLLERRAQKIEKGLQDARHIEEEFKKMEEKKEERIREAKEETQKIIAEAQKIAEKSKEEIILKAKDEAKEVIEQTKEQVKREKEKITADVKKEAADLIVLATSQVLGKTLSKEIDKKLIDQVLKEKIKE